MYSACLLTLYSRSRLFTYRVSRTCMGKKSVTSFRVDVPVAMSGVHSRCATLLAPHLMLDLRQTIVIIEILALGFAARDEFLQGRLCDNFQQLRTQDRHWPFHSTFTGLAHILVEQRPSLPRNSRHPCGCGAVQESWALELARSHSR